MASQPVGLSQQGMIQVERSANGQDFENIYSMENPGTGEHSFLDPLASPARTYYRLKFIGNSGQVSYSNIESIIMATDGQVRISPNPAKGKIMMSFPAAWQHQQVHATLFNSEGKIIQDHHFPATSSKDILLNNTFHGTCFLRIENQISGEVQLLPLMIIQ